MSANFRNLYAELLDALRQDHTAVGGTYDLSTVSGTHRVVWGETSIRHIPPATVLLGGIQGRSTYDAAAMGQYAVRYTVEWTGLVSTATQTPEDRALSAIDLANDVITATNRAHKPSSGYTYLPDVTEFLVSLDAIYGDGDDIPATFGVAMGTITMLLVDVTEGI